MYGTHSEKFIDYISNQTVVNNKLKLLLRDSSADDIVEMILKVVYIKHLMFQGFLYKSYIYNKYK